MQLLGGLNQAEARTKFAVKRSGVMGHVRQVSKLQWRVISVQWRAKPITERHSKQC